MNHPLTTPAVMMVGPRQVEVREQAVPPFADDEVLVRADATGISAGTELNVYRGVAPQLRRRQDPRTRLFVAGDAADWIYPFAYGYCATGRVEAVGASVTGLLPGERVFAYAPHRRFSVVKAARVVKLPALKMADHAVMLPNMNTAYNGVLDGRPPLGASLVVFGLGIVGQLLLRLLNRTGPQHLVAVDRIAHRRALAEAAGATAVLDPAADKVAEAVRDLTDGRGADIAYDVSGSPRALQEAIRTVGVDGTVVAMSWYGEPVNDLELMGEFHHNRVRIRSSQVGSVNPELTPLWSVPRRMARAIDALNAFDLEPLVSHRVALSRAPEMFHLLDERDPAMMQVIFRYDAGEGEVA